METENVLSVQNRDELRAWLTEHHDTAKECWVIVKRGRPVEDGKKLVENSRKGVMYGEWNDNGRLA